MTMFDIESRIRDWRQGLLAGETLRAQDIDELEDHLREEFESLRAPRALPPLLSEEERFLIATRRLGRADALTREFAKADPSAAWRRRWILICAGYVGIGFALCLINMAEVMVASTLARVTSPWWLVLNGAVTLAGVLCAIALVRSMIRSPWAARWRAAYAGKILTPWGLVLLTALAIGSLASISPLAAWMVEGSLGGMLQPATVVVLYQQIALTLAPFVLLALLLWRDRERLRAASALPLDDRTA